MPQVLNRIIPCTVLCLWASGCALLDPTDPFGPELAPASSSRRAGEGAAEVAGGALTWDRCLTLALARNPELSAEQWDSQAAEEDVSVTKAARWPSLHAVGGYRHRLDSETNDYRALAEYATSQAQLRLAVGKDTR